MRRPISATVFGAIGVFMLLAGVVLAILGSFAYVAIMAVGLFFTAATLISRSIASPPHRVAGVLALASVALLVFGQVATPIFVAGWGLLAGSAALAVLSSRRDRSS